MKSLRIGLLGRMGAGKSTLAKRICDLVPGTRIESMAAPLKDIARTLFRMTGKDRELLQSIGTAMRAIDKDVWVSALLDRVGPTDSIVVDDVRFPNEIRMLKEAGFRIVYVDVSETERESNLRTAYGDTADVHIAAGEHESERAHEHRSLADAVVTPDCDLEAFLVGL